MAGLASGKGAIAILRISAAADFDACRAVRRRKASDISVQVQTSACMRALYGIGRRGCDSGGSTPSCLILESEGGAPAELMWTMRGTSGSGRYPRMSVTCPPRTLNPKPHTPAAPLGPRAPARSLPRPCSGVLPHEGRRTPTETERALPRGPRTRLWRREVTWAPSSTAEYGFYKRRKMHGCNLSYALL